ILIGAGGVGFIPVHGATRASMREMNCRNANDSRYFVPPMELSPVHVRTFAEVVRHASFSRAAETLHVSQPAVSHHIRHLESALGARLLERVGRRAFPTAAGEVLLEHAGRALAELEAPRPTTGGRAAARCGRSTSRRRRSSSTSAAGPFAT